MWPRPGSRSLWNEFLWQYEVNKVTLCGSPEAPWVSSQSAFPTETESSRSPFTSPSLPTSSKNLPVLLSPDNCIFPTATSEPEVSVSQNQWLPSAEELWNDLVLEQWTMDPEIAFTLPRACLLYLLEMTVHIANLVLVMRMWDLSLSWVDWWYQISFSE